MQRVDGNYLYEVGSRIHPLADLVQIPNVTWAQAHSPLFIAEGALEPLITRTVFQLRTSLQTGHVLLAAIRDMSAILIDPANIEAYQNPIDGLHLWRLQNALTAFEAVLGAELQLIPLYVVAPIGRDPDEPNSSHQWSKMKVMSIIDRTSGRARSVVLDFVTTKTVTDAIIANVSPDARLITDQASQYLKVGAQMADHQSVNHGAREYVRKSDVTVHTNTVEGYFSVFKRGMRGVYQHCSKKHLHRYMAEFDFRYSNRSAVGVEDISRADTALTGFAGKRLTYETVGARRSSEEVRIIW
jgi:transposase-like protein